MKLVHGDKTKNSGTQLNQKAQLLLNLNNKEEAIKTIDQAIELLSNDDAAEEDKEIEKEMEENEMDEKAKKTYREHIQL